MVERSARGFVTVACRPVTAARLASLPVPTDPRQHLGRLGEQLAAEHLQRLGYAIVCRNHRTRYGEIDLIARDGDCLVFCEVNGGFPPRRCSPIRRV
jgi:hypothetical protein